MPGPAGFADALSEAQAVLLIEELFGEQSGDESAGSGVLCVNDNDSVDRGDVGPPEERQDKSLYERDVPTLGLTPDEVQAALPRPVKEFSIISANIGSFELHKDVAMNWPHTVKCFQETQLDKGMIRHACNEALFSNQHILAGRPLKRSLSAHTYPGSNTPAFRLEAGGVLIAGPSDLS